MAGSPVDGRTDQLLRQFVVEPLEGDPSRRQHQLRPAPTAHHAPGPDPQQIVGLVRTVCLDHFGQHQGDTAAPGRRELIAEYLPIEWMNEGDANRSTGKRRRNQAFLRQPFDGIRLAGGERLEFRLEEGLPDGKQLQRGVLGHVDIRQPGLDQLDQSVGGMQLTDEAPHPAFESKDVIGER